MTTQTEQPRAAQQQGTHHFIMTLQQPFAGGFSMATFSNHITPAPGMTRHDVYQALQKQIVDHDPDMAGASVVFFSLEPNQL